LNSSPIAFSVLAIPCHSFSLEEVTALSRTGLEPCTRMKEEPGERRRSARFNSSRVPISRERNLAA
jgi:hypothetical protein